MASFALVLMKHKQKKDGTHPIYLRITEHRKPRYVSTGIAVLPKYWNENSQQIRKNHPNQAALNHSLQKKLTAAQNTEIAMKKDPKDKIPSKKLKREITGDSQKDFFVFADQYIQRLDEKDQYWQWKKVRVVVSKLREFAGESLYFDEIDIDFVEQFDTWLKTERDNNQNTRYKNLSVFRKIIRQAIEKQVITASDNPFIHIKLKQQKVRKEKLTIEQIKRIEQLDLPERTGVWHAKNYFLFSFYSAGIRFGDLCCLKWNNFQSDRLIYVMNKTGTEKNIKLIPQAADILNLYKPDIVNPEAYIFPLLDNNTNYDSDRQLKKQISACNARVNQDLKILAHKADIQTNISTHIARHSFADYAREKGMSLYSISKALAHSSLSHTEQYLKDFDAEQLDDEMNNLFGGEDE